MKRKVSIDLWVDTTLSQQQVISVVKAYVEYGTFQESLGDAFYSRHGDEDEDVTLIKYGVR